MKRFATFLISLAPLSVAACSATAQETVEAEVARIALEMPRSIDYVEFDTFMGLFAEDAVIYFPFAPTRVEGYDNIEQSVRPLFQRNAGADVPLQGFEASEVEVKMLGRDGAVVTWIIDRATDTARRSVVLRRRNGEWKIVLVHADNWEK